MIMGTVRIHIYAGKLRLKQLEILAPGHPASKWQSLGSTQIALTFGETRAILSFTLDIAFPIEKESVE
jgi:hypothetical protein